MENPKIYEAMAAIMRDIEPIAKNSKNKDQGFMYRGIDDMYNALHGIFAKHGVFVTKEIIASERSERTTKSGSVMFVSIIDYRFRFNAVDGSYTCTEERGEAMDTGDKASNKSSSIAMKYALMHALLIPTAEEKDPDAVMPPAPIPAPSQEPTGIPSALVTQVVNAPADAKREYFAKLYTAHLKQPYAEALSELVKSEIEKRKLTAPAK